MLGIDRRVVQNFDWVLLFLILLLTTFGIANLMSATAAGSDGAVSDIARRQLLALGISGIALLVVIFIDYRHYERFATPLYVAMLLLLVGTLLFAPVTRGSRAWLLEGRLQPSEFAKIVMVIALARYFSRNPPSDITRLRDLVRPGLIVAAPVALIMLQPDMGVALLTLLVATTFLPFLRIPWRTWAVVAALGAAALAGVWSYGLKDYQQQRILDFVDPSRDPLSSGYQAMQSRIAVGSGGLFGKGWFDGTQTQLRFLPTQHTDFVFSVLAEEWGFVGSVIVLGLYATLLVWGLWIARNSKDPFGALLAVGLVGTLFWPALVNVAMVLGLAPVIGVPLPLFSYGGTALLAASISLGLLLNVSMRRYVF
ncbi:MAG: rod shape-determining protein RodA [Proteobacteria bacterium]|nr:rod shape-determining protein RodA [Pseudomonadota bacterium]